MESTDYLHPGWDSGHFKKKIGRQIEYAMSSKNFPKDTPIQFWTHVLCDKVPWEKYNGTPLDLLHPSMYWDNEIGKRTNLVHPDIYMFLD